MSFFGSIYRVLLLSFIFGSFASCGPSPQAGGGIGGTGSVATVPTVAAGPVTGFGSVFVSGNEFDTNGAVITVDGQTNAGEGQLKKGMVVLVNGTISKYYGAGQAVQRTARTVLYEDTIEGPVQSVALDGLSLVVLGQTVLINQSTIIDLSIPTLGSLTPIDLVEVSGFVSGPGTVVATLISRKGGAADYQVKGFITQHDKDLKSFTIGSLAVDYTDTDISQMPSPAGNAWNGLLVDVRGSQVSLGGSGQYGIRMTSTKVKPEGLGSEDSEGAEIEGFVTQVVAPGDFYLGSVHVQTSAGTTFEGGTLSDIVVGAHLEVHGSLVSGIVNATKVEFEGETELQANVATINSSDNTVTLTGLAGLVIQFDDQTALHGQGNPRRLDDLHNGDHLQIHGRLRGGNVILAKEVERSDPKSSVRLQGLVTSVAYPFIVLLGASINTSSIPESGFLGRDGVIGRSAFFSGLSSGKKVSVQGNAVTTTVDWTSATRKD
jgi:hypothetical protein